MKQRTINTLRKFGMIACRKAWQLNRERGEGARSIAMGAMGDCIKLSTTRQVDAAIDAYDAVRRRTEALLKTYRDLPGEFMMLKGVLCLQTVKDPETSTGDAFELYELGLDMALIGQRMDEINGFKS